ncbi:MAG TPA: trimethylamine methyltransferase family protein, partial [Candidatus Angelobacter sp.]|nr:trimethylamine methyltransferase family protein [Candidatus Angelobacter sp.]
MAEPPVRAGLEGGRYLPLKEVDLIRIHRAALQVLEEIGLADAIPSCVEVLTKKGCTLSPEGRLLFPRGLIEDTIAGAARNFVLHGQDAKYDMEPWGKRVYFGTAGA